MKIIPKSLPSVIIVDLQSAKLIIVTSAITGTFFRF